MDPNRKAIWISQKNPRKKKVVKSLIGWGVSDMAYNLAQAMYELPIKKISTEWDFWAWEDEFVKKHPDDCCSKVSRNNWGGGCTNCGDPCL